MWLVSAALAGYLTARLTPVVRALFAIAGLCALVPAGAFSGAIYTDAFGVVLGIAVIAYAVYTARGKARAQAAE